MNRKRKRLLLHGRMSIKLKRDIDEADVRSHGLLHVADVGRGMGYYYLDVFDEVNQEIVEAWYAPS